MIRMRLFVGLMVFVLAVGGGLLLGQDTGDAPGKSATRLPPGWSKLGLTDKQKSTVYRIQGDYQKKIEPLQRQINGLRKQERAELLKVLNDDQRTRLKEIISSKAGGDTPASEEKGSKDKKQ